VDVADHVDVPPLLGVDPAVVTFHGGVERPVRLPLAGVSVVPGATILRSAVTGTDRCPIV